MSFEFKRLINTPVAEATFVYIDRPTMFKNGEFIKDGVACTDQGAKYSIALLLDPADEQHKEFIDSLEALLKEAGARNKGKIQKSGYKLVSPLKDYSDEEGNPTGLKILRFKTNAATPDGSAKQIPVFDAADPPQRLPEDTKVFGGSKVSVAFTAADYSIGTSKMVGMSLYLVAVQLHEAAQTRNTFGFQANATSLEESADVRIF